MILWKEGKVFLGFFSKMRGLGNESCRACCFFLLYVIGCVGGFEVVGCCVLRVEGGASGVPMLCL